MSAWFVLRLSDSHVSRSPDCSISMSGPDGVHPQKLQRCSVGFGSRTGDPLPSGNVRCSLRKQTLDLLPRIAKHGPSPKVELTQLNRTTPRHSSTHRLCQIG